MINIVNGANQKVYQMVFEKSVSAFYLSVCERYSKGYTQLFITDLQNLITKVGIIMSEVSTSKKRISYCSSALDYLCNDVLNSNNLYKRFDEIGINAKGNIGKHSLKSNTIDLDKTVIVFNSMIDNIANRYNLPALKKLLICKRDSSNKAMTNVIQTTRKSQDQNKNTANPSAQTSDGNLILKTSLLKGPLGRYQKGIIKKTPMLNFRISLNIHGNRFYKIKEIEAQISSAHSRKTISLPNQYESLTDVNLEAAQFSGKIKVVVILKYKISLLVTKEIKTTVSGIF